MVNVFSLFSGCGGCSLGLKQAGFEIKLAVDHDKDACETYATNLGSEVVWCADISTVTPRELLERSRLHETGVDMIVGGPPCQGFSSAGAKDWTDSRNILIRKFVEIVTTLKPTWFIMENVEGMLTANDGMFVIEAIAKFLEAGYWVRAQKVYMEQYGLPQRRKRVIIVGNRENCAFDFPQSQYYEIATLPFIEQYLQLSIQDAIGDLPPASLSNKAFYASDALCDYQRRMRRVDGQLVQHHQTKLLNDSMQQRIEHLTPGATMKDLPENLQHASFTRRALRRVMDGTPTEKRGGAPSGLKRLIASQPSLTITSASPTEFIHPFENRPLTLRECARIQSFPDWYEFAGSWGAIATQIGNAIPPLFMQVLGTHIKRLATWQQVDNSRGRWLGIEATKSNGMSPALIKMMAGLTEKTYSYANI